VTAQTFADHVVDYAQAGWPCILPVPPETKTPPPAGFTGAEGLDTEPLTLVDFATRFPGYSIALRMPMYDTWAVIGIDVDQYAKGGQQKRGAETIAAYAERWGTLPATWTSTAREPDGPSRIYFYRVPVQRYATRLATATTGDVEIIQRHHRYAVVWPSVHKDAGTYTWYDPTGAASPRPPAPWELAELSPSWVQGLAELATSAPARSADAASGQALLDQLENDWREECAEITSARLQAVELLGRAEAGSRHDVMTERTHHLVQTAASGHTGVARALLEVRTLWEQLIAGEDRPGELERALLTSAQKAVTAVGPVQIPTDPCLMVSGFNLPAPMVGDPGAGDQQLPDGTQLQIVEPLRWASTRQLLGAQAFDPNADLDQTLAERVLERMWPALRYAYDSRGWIVRAPERWELHGNLAAWAVAQLAPLMPLGDPTAEKDSDAYARAKRRTRLMSSGGARAIANKIEDLVVGGMHPMAVALADLDADPEILWAGGMPYDLRRSANGPTFSEIDPATPHLSTAAVRPELRPTPLWDAFTAAVWPDPELRRWALRVLSIALTGYADRALPILLGDTGRGKTQVVALLMSVLGGYAHAANPKLLAANANAHDSIVFALKGRRLSFIDEAPRDNRSGQERLKQLTGGGELTANQMNQNPITFRPTHTLVLTANDEPMLTDPAVRSRTRLIPCVGDPEQVGLARAAIGHVSGPAWRAEAPGVLAAMMTEAAGWLADRRTADVTAAPEGIRFLVEQIGAEQDPVWQWLEEEVEPYEPGTSSRELYQSFRASCLRSGIRPDQIPSETKWGKDLSRRGFPSLHTREGKRRALRIRQIGPGHLPQAPTPAEFVTGSDGLVTGSEAQPVTEFSQVNPRAVSDGDGCDGFLVNEASRAHASARAHESDPENASTRHASTERTQPDLQKEPVTGAANASCTATAREKAAEKREAKRLEAIAAAAGGLVELPAVVTRDGTVLSVSTADAAQLLAPALSDDGELTVDVEHTGFPVGHQHYRLRTVQLGTEALAVVLDPHEESQALLIAETLAAAKVLHAHSATADLVPLDVAGLLWNGLEDAWQRMHDTVIPAKLADPASTGSDPDLKKLSAAVLGEHAVSPRADEARKALFKAGKWLTDTKATTPIERSGWAQVDSRCTTMVTYAASDVLDDAAVARRLPQIPAEILERERLAQRLTARVARHGLRIDGEHVEQLLPQQRDALAGAGDRLKAYGVDNPGSDQQVAAAAVRLGAQLPVTKTGRPSVAAGVLEPLAGDLERDPATDLEAFVRARLDYQKAETSIGLFLEPYQNLVRHGDGRARPTVYTLGADTGRMSCVRPNLQQITRQGGYRACITADPAELLASADFAGVELRVAAALSQDLELARIIDEADRDPEAKNDVHWQIARLVWGAGATKADRYKAKPMVFGRIYGAGVTGLARDNGVSLEVARAVIEAMGVIAPGLAEWSRMVMTSVEAGHTQYPTYAGRVIHLDRRYPHKAPNYLIQGTARELLIDALVKWSQTPWGSNPAGVLLPVHDELVVKVPEHEAAEATAVLTSCMATSLYGVEIKAEASEPSYAWKDAA
jgi:DNA polymerase I-like protein with 3'-5' exonuclease and polymerase domains/phage/plasmid-associated DNA primase